MGRLPSPLLAAIASALAAAGCASLGDGPDVHALPVLERDRPVTGAPRVWDAGWPFGHGEKDLARTTAGARPLYRTVATDRRDRLEVLYPLFRREVEKDGAVSTRIFPIYWKDSIPFGDGDDRDTAILPILFWGNEPGWGPYFAVFPLGGVLHHKLLSDRITFVLFPLYVGTAYESWRGHHIIWPLIHWGSDGTARRAFRFWPFYGRHTRDGVFDRYSFLWPIFQFSWEYQDRPFASFGWLVWPLYGREESIDGQTSSSILWPLFHFADGPRAYERSLPFPFYRVRREWVTGENGERVLETELFWLWPFYGRYDRTDEEHSGFWMWPFVYWWDDLAVKGRDEGLIVVPFWKDQVFRPDDGSPPDRSWKAWPVAQGDSRGDGSMEWSALAPIPWFRWEELEANWGVFWELIHVRRGPDGSRAVDLLFSFIRHRRGPGGDLDRIPLLASTSSDSEGTRWSFLEGLLGGETDAHGASSLRLLWLLRIPLGGGGTR